VYLNIPSFSLDELITATDGSNLLLSTLLSMSEIFFGAIIGGVIAIMMGALTYKYKRFGKTIGTIFLLAAPIPVIFWMPAVIAIFPSNFAQATALCSIITFFLVYLAIFGAYKRLPQEYIHLANLYSIKPFRQFFHIVLPFATQAISISVRISLAFCWVALYIAEVKRSGGMYGLGAYIRSEVSLIKWSSAWNAAILLILAAYLLDLIVAKFFNHITKWERE